MTYADFEYYSGVYMGAVSGTDFPRLVVRASSFLDYYTRNKAQDHADLDAVKMCCCVEQNRELFSDCGPFCMNGGCEEGKMTCGKSISPQMLPTDIIRVDFPKLCEASVLDAGTPRAFRGGTHPDTRRINGCSRRARAL